MKSIDEISKIQEELKEIIAFKSDKEKLEFELDIIQLNIMSEIQKIMDNEGVTRADLAQKMNKSKSLITQLFTADKQLNLKHLVL